MTIHHPRKVKEYYQEQNVAQEYITKRFSEPLNIIEHQQQINLLNYLIKSTNSKHLLEFAPGPARITAEINHQQINSGISIDSSKSMLTLASQRMQTINPNWQFQQADILNHQLHLKQPADLLFCFRFLLHFHKKDREKIYTQAKSNLKPNGYIVFEAMNKIIISPLRFLLGTSRYFVYDKLYTKSQLVTELEQHGFKVISLHPVLKRFWLQSLLSRPFKIAKQPLLAKKIINFLEKIPTTQPYEWIVLAQKK